MKMALVALAAILITGCSTPPVETEYRQPWTVYKSRADIVPQLVSGVI